MWATFLRSSQAPVLGYSQQIKEPPFLSSFEIFSFPCLLVIFFSCIAKPDGFKVYAKFHAELRISYF